MSAAAPSPFTPIADYAFLSNCHTGALVAPDGSVDWLSVPRFDAPSAFGSLLDRGAGAFRVAAVGGNPAQVSGAVVDASAGALPAGFTGISISPSGGCPEPSAATPIDQSVTVRIDNASLPAEVQSTFAIDIHHPAVQRALR